MVEFGDRNLQTDCRQTKNEGVNGSSNEGPPDFPLISHSKKTRHRISQAANNIGSRISLFSRYLPMIRLLILAFFLSWVSQKTLSQSLKSKYSEEVYVLNRIEKNKSKKRKQRSNYRLDLSHDSASVSLRITQTSKYPRKLKRIQVRYRDIRTGRTDFYVASRRSMLSAIRHELVENSASQNLTPRMLRDAKNFAEGRNGGNTMKYRWHNLISTRLPEGHEELTVKVKTGLFRNTIYETDTLPARSVFALPELDPPACLPFDRFFQRKDTDGWGLQNVRYEAFRPSDRKIIRKSFEIFFEKNSSNSRLEDLQPVIDYLKENDLTILHVRIEGYSSVEGDSLRNEVLHKKRAQRLVSVLQRHNNEPIGADTVITTEAWTSFRELIRNSPYKWLDTLDNDEIRTLVNGNTDVSQGIEPYLRQLRKARLSITLASRYTDEELVARVTKEFHRVSQGLSASRTTMAAVSTVEKRLSGIIRYMDELISAGTATPADLAEMVDQCPYPDQASILLFYHLIKKYEKQADNLSLDSMFFGHKWNNIFEVAHNNIITLIQATGRAQDRTRRLRQATDVQYYAILYIQRGVLDPEVLCSMPYPDSPEFYGLKLNQHAIAHELSDRFSFSCFRVGERTTRMMTSAMPEERDRIEKMLAASSVTKEPVGARKPSFDYSAKGDYYYFMQTLFVKGDSRIREFVFTSDKFVQFDLFAFLRANITAWDPVNNHFYDSAVQLKELNRLIGKLKTIDKHICQEQISQLYLDFHLKALHYLDATFTLGSKADAVIAEKSLNYISDYYRRRADRLFPKLSIYVGDGLNSFANLPTRTAAPAYAGLIPAALIKNTILSDQEQERWSVYRKILNRH